MVAPPELRLLTVEQAVTEYLRGVQRAVLGGSLSPATQQNYERDLREFVLLAGADTTLDDLTAEDIDDLLLAYASQPDRRYSRRPKPGPAGAPGRGPGAQARFRQSVSRLFTQATRRGWVQLNPMPDTQVRPRARTLAAAARTALPEPSAAALLHAPEEAASRARRDQRLGERDTAILRLLMEVGPRVSELCALDRADLTERTGATWLEIRRGKGGKPRSLPLSPATAAAIAAWLALPRTPPPTQDPAERREDAERALFTTYRGRRIQPRDVQNLVDRAVSRLPAEVRRRVTPHGLRHTAATLLLSSGAADIKTVQALLGHASVATTGVYLDEVSHEMVRAVAAHPVTGE